MQQETPDTSHSGRLICEKPLEQRRPQREPYFNVGSPRTPRRIQPHSPGAHTRRTNGWPNGSDAAAARNAPPLPPADSTTTRPSFTDSYDPAPIIIPPLLVARTFPDPESSEPLRYSTQAEYGGSSSDEDITAYSPSTDSQADDHTAGLPNSTSPPVPPRRRLHLLSGFLASRDHPASAPSLPTNVVASQLSLPIGFLKPPGNSSKLHRREGPISRKLFGHKGKGKSIKLWSKGPPEPFDSWDMLSDVDCDTRLTPCSGNFISPTSEHFASTSRQPVPAICPLSIDLRREPEDAPPTHHSMLSNLDPPPTFPFGSEPLIELGEWMSASSGGSEQDHYPSRPLPHPPGASQSVPMRPVLLDRFLTGYIPGDLPPYEEVELERQGPRHPPLSRTKPVSNTPYLPPTTMAATTSTMSVKGTMMADSAMVTIPFGSHDNSAKVPRKSYDNSAKCHIPRKEVTLSRFPFLVIIN